MASLPTLENNKPLQMTVDLNKRIEFQNRHIGPDQKELQAMLNAIGVSDLEELIDQTVPISGFHLL
jgi:hypothetical protein